LREFSIGLNFVEITIILAITLTFIRSYQKDRLNATEFAIIGFSSLAFARVFYIFFDYYIHDNPYLYTAWVFLYLGIIFLVLSLFKGVSRSIFRYFPHKIPYFIGFGLYLVIIWLIRALNSIVFYIGSVGVGVLLLIPIALQLNKFIYKSGGYIKRYFGLSILGLPLAFLGIGLGSIWQSLSGIDSWLVKIGSHSIFLVGLILLALSLWSLPSLNEFDWEQSLSHLYVLKPGGICLYSFNFKVSKPMDPQLLGSGLTGVCAMVQEMTKSKKQLEFIKQESKNLYLQQGKQVNAVIIGEEELRIIFDKLKMFVHEFERLFPDISTWTFCIEESKIAGMLVRSIFSI
jgi:hypothetical protein